MTLVEFKVQGNDEYTPVMLFGQDFSDWLYENDTVVILIECKNTGYRGGRARPFFNTSRLFVSDCHREYPLPLNT
jgi:hypothetical protein